MPEPQHMSRTIMYHDEGNLPLTTALEIAVEPTPNAPAISRRPSTSAIFSALIIAPIYPPVVDWSISTNGGLPINPPSVNTNVMTDRPDYTEIGERLALVRTGFSDLSQKDWANMHSFSPTQYNNWETGKRRISVDAAEVLVERYGLSLDFIYRGRVDGLSETARKVL